MDPWENSFSTVAAVELYGNNGNSIEDVGALLGHASIATTAHKLAREAVLRGVPVHIMDDGAYGGYSEPSDQWEAEGRVTLDGAELELCQECKAPVHYYDPDGAPYCETHGPGL